MTVARAASCAAALVALATLYAGVHWGSTVGGGADSYGYVSQAALWRSGRLTLDEPIARQSPWPFAIETWAPLGYRPAPGRRDAIVPLYSPGLPLIMALFQAVGGFCAAFLVVPTCGALTVWLTYVLGQRMFGTPAASLMAAVFVATSPIFLYQLMNPMSDVPATAAWTLSVVLGAADWPLTAGLAAGVALLIRPNLTLLAVVLIAWTAVAGKRPIRLMGGFLPALLAVASINASLYGAPWISGYGSLTDLYDPRYATTNIRQFGAWMIETQTPLVTLALGHLAFPWIGPRALVPYPRLIAGGMIAAVLASYLFYIPFDAWWYLRFLLPMWPIIMVLIALGIRALVTPERWVAPDRRVAWGRWVARNRWVRWVTCGIVVTGIAANGIRIAAARSVFELGRGERKFVDVARFVANHTDGNAVLISLQHSGSLRLYAGRLTLRFDQLDGTWLDRVIAFLRDRGRHPYIVLDGTEVDAFKRRFANSEAGRLDWLPMAIASNPAVFMYDAVDRRPSGEPLAIGVGSARRPGWRCDPPYESRIPLRTE